MTGEGEKATKFEIDGKSTAKNNNRNRFAWFNIIGKNAKLSGRDREGQTPGLIRKILKKFLIRSKIYFSQTWQNVLHFAYS